jgi:hypothetical protein
METVREKILENLKTTLEGITVANGYNFDFTSGTIQRWSMHGNSLVNLPAVVLSCGDESEQSAPYPLEECALSVYLDCFFVSDEDEATSTDTYLNRLQGDIKKAVLADHTRGGHAVDTNVLGTTPFETTEGQHYAGIIVEIEIKYRHQRLDPALSA